MGVDSARGFIVLYRSLLEWEWYTEANTARLFIHLLLTVNHTRCQWQGITIDRGQRVASYAKLAQETGLTVKEVRTALNHLKRTGEVAHSATSKFGLFTVKNYNKYQTPGTQKGTQRADSGQPEGRQWADEGQQINKDNKNNKDNKDNKDNNAASRTASGQSCPAQKPSHSCFVPPDETQAIAFFRENGSSKTEGQIFWDYYQANGWKISGKTPMQDWQAAARNWIRRAGQYARQQTGQAQPKTSRDILSDAVDMIQNGDFSFMEV